MEKKKSIKTHIKKPLSKKAKIIIITASTLCAICLCLGVLFCLLNQKKYSLDISCFDSVIGINEDVNFGNIKVVNDKNGESIIVTQDMIISCDSTNSLGEKTIIFEYDGVRFETTFEVKYRVEYIVKGDVISNQFVLALSEIQTPQNPECEGYEFIGWDKEMPTNLTDNLQFNAIMSSTTLLIPTLKKVTATYGDRLADVVLPHNDNGSWVFVDDLSTFVGNCGINNFDVKFSPNTIELVEKFDTINIEVEKKELTFNIQTTEFVYDGEQHFPEYSLSEDVDVDVQVLFGRAQTNYSETRYQFGFIVNDDNYSGYISGSFAISKANVTVSIQDLVIDYGTTPNMQYVVENFDNQDILDITLVYPSNLNVGTYQIGATSPNENVNLIVQKGSLTVNPIYLNPAPHDPVLSTKTTHAVYGDLLSTVTFGNVANGVWSWKNPTTIINKINDFKAVAIFTPSSSNYKSIEREILVDNIDKKTLQITASQDQNTYTYDGTLHTIVYTIANGEYGDLQVDGNISKCNAGKYTTTLVINDEFYQGSLNASLIIDKATPTTNFQLEYQTTWFAGITLNAIDIASLGSGYSWKTPTYSLDTISTHTVVAVFTPQDTLNYKTVEQNISVAVNKAQAQIENVETKYDFVYNGNAYELSSVRPSHYEEQLVFTYIKDSISVVELKDAGTYNVTISLPESRHYTACLVQTEVVIQKGEFPATLQTLNATYEDRLADVQLLGDANGSWSWQEDLNTFVGDVGNQTHKAIYTPNNINYNTTEYDAIIVVSAKRLTFNIIQNVFTYSGEQYDIEYSLVDNDDNDYSHLTVSGNVQQKNAGNYNISLKVTNTNYSAQKDTTLIINRLSQTPTIPTNLSARYLDKVQDVALPQETQGEWQILVDENALVGEVGDRQFDAIFVYYEEGDLDNLADYTTKLTINVLPYQVTKPSLAKSSAVYNGQAHTPVVVDNDEFNASLYTYNSLSYINVDTYQVILSLKDKVNYIWQGETASDTALDFAITKGQAQITSLTINEWTYGEQASEVQYTYSDFVNSSAGNIIIEYLDGDNVSKTAPTNAGTYSVRVTIISTTNYNGTQQQKEFVIKKRTVEQPNIINKKYNGTKQVADISATDKYTIKQNNGGENVGSYDVILTLNDFDNYKWKDSLTQDVTLSFEIVKAEAKIYYLVMESWTYGTMSSNPDVQISDFVEQVELTYFNNAGVEISKPTNAGQYTIKATILPTNNYSGDSKEKTFAINKASVIQPVLQTSSVEYNGQPHTPRLVDNNEGNTNLYDATIHTYTEKGEYDVVLTIKDFTNYKWQNADTQTITLQFEITKAENEWTTTPSIQGWTYNQEANSPTAVAKFGSVEITYRSSGSTTYTINRPVNAGEYFVRFYVAENEYQSYSSLEKELNFVIEKASIPVPTITSKEYTGLRQYADVDDGEYYSVVTNDGGVEKGSYDVVLKINDFTNYKWQGYSEETITLKFNITTALNSWETEPSIQGWTYGDTPNSPVSKALFGQAIVTYKAENTEEYSIQVPSSAGKYFALFEVAGTDEYGPLREMVEFTISKQDIDIPTITPKVYTGETQTADIQDTEKYTVTTNAGGINVGKYNVALTIKDFTNYKWRDKETQEITLQFEITKEQVQISNLTIASWTYGQQAGEPQVEVSSFVEKSSVQYTYYDSDDQVISKPTNAGTYKVQAKVEDTSNYTGASTDKVGFTISKQDIEIPTITPKVYTGEMQTADIQDTENYTVTTNNGGKDVGKYDVVLTIKDFTNYKWQDKETREITLQFEITKEQVQISNLTIASWKYGQPASEPQVEVSSFVDESSVQYTYYNSDDQVISKPTNAGTYKVEAKVEDTSNYIGASTDKVVFEIAKKVVNSPSLQQISLVYDGEEHTPVVVDNDENNKALYTETIPPAKEFGEYDIKLKIVDFTNYKWKESTSDTLILHFNITSATNKWDTLPNISSWKYQDTPSTPTAKAKFGDVAITYKAKNSVDSTYTNVIPTNSGEYVAKFYVPASEHQSYNGLSQEIEFSITKLSVTAPTLQVNSLEYDGKEHTPVVVDNDENNKTLYTETIPPAKEFGEYNVELKIVDFTNYKWQESTNDTLILKFNITKAINEWIQEPNISNLTFGQTASTPTAKAKFGDVIITYREKESSTYTTAQPVNAGEYYVKFFVPASTLGSYNELSKEISFVINKGQVAVPRLQTNSIVYDGQAHTPIVVDDNINNKELYSVYAPSCTNVIAEGYQVRLTIKDKANYIWTLGDNDDKYLNFTITQAQASITSLTLSSWIYGQTANNPQITTNSYVLSESIEYKYFDENETLLETKPNNVGKYKVQAIIKATSNYLGTSSTLVAFQIDKYTPNVTLPAYNGTYYMNVDSVENIMNGKTAKNANGQDILGSWTYSEITYAHGDKASSFVVTFTPQDTHNYQTVTQSVNITVHSTAMIDSTYYPTIERATASAVSGNTIYVLPDTTGKVVIANDISIISGVTMVLLYGANTTDRNSSGEGIGDGKYYAPSNNNPGTYRKTLVKLLAGKTITLAGILEIAGELSGAYGGMQYAGNTGRNYAELVMCANSKIEVTGSLKVTGYLTEELSSTQNSTAGNGSIINATTGSIYLPFVLRDFKGGSYMYAVYNRIEESGWLNKKEAMECSTFNQYQLINIYPKLKIAYTGSVVGYANLYASDQNNYTMINLIGSASSNLLQLTDNTYSSIVAKYDKTNDKNIIDIYGGMTLNSLSLSIQTGLTGLTKVSVSTEKVYFPINWAFDISLNKAQGQTSATYKLEQKIKIMPGARFVINEGVNVSMLNVSIYNGYTDQNTKPSPFYPEKADPVFIVNGSLVCASIGGQVSSSVSGATIKVASSTSITTHETKGEVSGKSVSASVDFCDITQTLTLLGAQNVTSVATNTVYTFNGTTWG